MPIEHLYSFPKKKNRGTYRKKPNHAAFDKKLSLEDPFVNWELNQNLYYLLSLFHTCISSELLMNIGR